MITHEQARDLRVIDAHSVPGNVDFYSVAALDLAYVEGNPYTDDVGLWTLTVFGRQALAEYEAAHVIVPREVLERIHARHTAMGHFDGPEVDAEYYALDYELSHLLSGVDPLGEHKNV